MTTQKPKFEPKCGQEVFFIEGDTDAFKISSSRVIQINWNEDYCIFILEGLGNDNPFWGCQLFPNWKDAKQYLLDQINALKEES